MKNVKSIVFVISVIVIIVYLFINVLQPDYDKRFKNIVKEYDRMYSKRLTDMENENIIRCYKLDDTIGFLVVGEGYEDDILLYAELNSEKTEKITILYHNETIGYGDLVVEEWFLKRLYIPYSNGLTTVRNRKENANEVIAITGATLTSETVVKAINECAQIMEDIKNE